MLTPEEEIELKGLEAEFGPASGGLTAAEEQELAALEREFGAGAGEALLRDDGEVQTPATDPNLQAAPSDPQVSSQELSDPFSNADAMAMFDQAIEQEQGTLGDDTVSLMEELKAKVGEGSVLGTIIGRTLSNPANQVVKEATRIKSDEGTKKKGDQHISYILNKKEREEGIVTGGYGHQLTTAEKKLYPEGSVIPSDVVEKWFKKDMQEAKTDAEKYLKGLRVDEEVFNIVVNMAFNMGRARLSKFAGMKKALSSTPPDYERAALEMEYIDADKKTRKTPYYRQTGDRAKRLIFRMRKLGDDS